MGTWGSPSAEERMNKAAQRSHVSEQAGGWGTQEAFSQEVGLELHLEKQVSREGVGEDM